MGKLWKVLKTILVVIGCIVMIPIAAVTFGVLLALGCALVFGIYMAIAGLLISAGLGMLLLL